MYALIIKPAALLMVKESYEWYELQKKGLGDEFLSELDSLYNKIEKHPEHYGKVEADFRQAVLKRFPFVVVFEIFNTEVVVFAVFHTKRNRKYNT
jgi:ParE toxin of type II toxin-antitoxin system, parDE